MKTKEAIDICEKRHDYGLYSSSAYNISKFHDAMDKIIESSKQGEKYKQMWEEFHYALAHINIGNYQNPCDKKMTDLEYVNRVVHNVKQKYFPKEVKL